jgi:hypothetical protein
MINASITKAGVNTYCAVCQISQDVYIFNLFHGRMYLCRNCLVGMIELVDMGVKRGCGVASPSASFNCGTLISEHSEQWTIPCPKCYAKLEHAEVDND